MTEFVKFCWALAVFGLLYQTSDSLPSLSSENDGLIGKARGRSLFKARGQEKDNICLTRGCVKAAAAIISNMDKSIDPCDDFYQFACGNYIKKTVIDDDKTSQTTISEIEESVKNQLRMIFEEPIQPNDQKPFKMAKLLYKSCMDKEKIEKQGLGPIKEMLKKFGGWPVLEGDNWNESEFTWKDSVYKFRREGYDVNYFINVFIGTDLKNNSKRTIYLDQASLGLNREYLVKGTKNKIVSAYYRYMVDIAVLFGADRRGALEELYESLDFEMNLAEVSLPYYESRNESKYYNPMKIADLQQNFPRIPWQEYLNNILNPLTIRQDDILIVSSPIYLSALEILLITTPKRIQANYVIWRAVASSIEYLTEEVRERHLKYSTELSGRTKDNARWKECVDVSSDGFKLAIGPLYGRRYLNKDAKKAALEMVNSIKKEMLKTLRYVDWMDDETRKNAIDKAKSMTSTIAYPDELLDDEILNQLYNDLEVTDQDYYTSILNLTKFKTDKKFSILRQPVFKSDYIIDTVSAGAQARNSLNENNIHISAGILQDTFFSSDRPWYMDYGAIGVIIGHEITHGFSGMGNQFDKDGNLINWWSDKTLKRYLEKVSCIIKQYGNYTNEEVGLKVDGVKTLDENVADVGGVTLAYRAYDDWTGRNGVEPRLPGLQHYSPRQMFWLSAANMLCSKRRRETLEHRAVIDEHSPDRFRVVGPLSNAEEFGRDFRCAPGSKMNRPQKCRVW